MHARVPKSALQSRAEHPQSNSKKSSASSYDSDKYLKKHLEQTRRIHFRWAFRLWSFFQDRGRMTRTSHVQMRVFKRHSLNSHMLESVMALLVWPLLMRQRHWRSKIRGPWPCQIWIIFYFYPSWAAMPEVALTHLLLVARLTADDSTCNQWRGVMRAC